MPAVRLGAFLDRVRRRLRRRRAPPPPPAPGPASNRRLQAAFLDIAELLRPEVFLDIGANDGAASLAVRDRLPGCEVHALEANPGIHARHHERLRAGGIAYWNLALSDAPGTVTLHVPLQLARAMVDGRLVPLAVQEHPDTGKASLLRRDEAATYREERVEAVTLDAFAQAHLGAADASFPPAGEDGRRVLLWIDVEGLAARVLAGAERLLESTAALLVEVEEFPFWQGGTDREALEAWLAARGFLALLRDTEYGDHQYNVLFVHRSRLAAVLPLALEGERGLAPRRDGIAAALARVTGGAGPDIPVLVPVFETVTYARDMVRQLQERGVRRIVLIDNASIYPPMRAWLAAPGEGVSVIRCGRNLGPRHVLVDPACLAALPELFCLTDPDLWLGADLPDDFLAQLAEVTERLRVGKVGFALDISKPAELRQEPFVINGAPRRIWEWEAQFWTERAGETMGGDPVYQAAVDTTFALYNKRHFASSRPLEGVRVAGRFTCRHRPWYPDTGLPPEEAAHYARHTRDSFYAHGQSSRATRYEVELKQG